MYRAQTTDEEREGLRVQECVREGFVSVRERERERDGGKERAKKRDEECVRE